MNIIFEKGVKVGYISRSGCVSFGNIVSLNDHNVFTIRDTITEQLYGVPSSQIIPFVAERLLWKWKGFKKFYAS